MKNRDLVLCLSAASLSFASAGSAQSAAELWYRPAVAETGRPLTYSLESNLFAITVEPTADLSHAQVGRARLVDPDRRKECFRNPPLRLIVEGADLFLRDGNYALRLRAEFARVLIGIVVPWQGNEQIGYLIIEELRFATGSAVPSLGQADRLLELRGAGDIVELVPRVTDYSACLDSSAAVPAELIASVRELGSRPLAWVTAIGLDGTTRALFQALGQAVDDPAAVERAIDGGRLGTALGASDLAVAAIGAAPDLTGSDWTWRAIFTLRRKTWDGCVPVGRTHLRCSDGTLLRIDDLFTRDLGSIFWDRPTGVMNVTVESEPSDAAIFRGAVRHTANTATEMDLFPQQVPDLRIEKTGYFSCPYGRRWLIDAIEGPRPFMTGRCVLIRLPRDDSKN